MKLFVIFVILGVAVAVLGRVTEHQSGRSSRVPASPRVSRAERARFEQLFTKLSSARVEETKEPIAPGVMSEKFLKRSSEQSGTDVVPMHPWEYQVFTFGISHKNRIYAVDIYFRVLLSVDELLSFTVVPDISETDKIYEIVASPVDEDYIIFMGFLANYITRDGGRSFTRQTANGFHGIQFHPTNKEWLLAEHEVSRGVYNAYYSTDLGSTFTKLAETVYQYDWCRAGTGELAQKRVCIVNGNRDTATFKYTDDLGVNWHTPLQAHAYFFYVHDRFFTLVADYGDLIDFYVSNDDGDTFRRAILPSNVSVGVLQRQQFFEDDNGIIWIVVHPQGGSNWGESSAGDLYVSDADGYKFTKTLHSIHTINGWYDLELVPSMEGTLIANQLIVSDPLLMQTRVTYDNGDTWLHLAHPQADYRGVPYPCIGVPDKCRLNLYGITTWLGAGGDGYFGSFYTVREAVGMIIGTGNVGNFLNASKSAVRTYFSRDGALSWDEIFNASTIYEYGDFGGLIVMAQNQVPTRNIYYSYNGGKSFNTLLLNEEVIVSNIITVSPRGERVIVLGFDPNSTSIRKFWGLDFSQIHERNCTEADYELWEPHDGFNGPKCVLGHDVLYRRRKRDSECFTDDGLNHIVNKTDCECTDDDYECDMGFERTTITNKCVISETDPRKVFEEIIITSCSNETNTMNVSSGYRKVPGDTCVIDIPAYAVRKVECKKISFFSTIYSTVTGSLPVSAIIGIIVLIVVVLVAGILGGIYLALRSQWFRRAFPNASLPSWVAAGYSNQLVDEVEVGPEFNGDLDVALDDDDDTIED